MVLVGDNLIIKGILVIVLSLLYEIKKIKYTWIVFLISVKFVFFAYKSGRDSANTINYAC